jgi:predicted NUDIX family phosphoesterase
MNPEELVLCTARSELPAAWLPHNAALPLTEAALLAGLAPAAPRWLPRSHAEHDALFKQWIPYVLLEDSTGAFAAYPRLGGEARLHGLHSLGLGGHVNPVDTPPAPSAGADFWRTTLWAGLHRELEEEFPAAVAGVTTFLGLINEDTGPVGRVHLGAVFHHRLAHNPPPPEGELASLAWLPRKALGASAWPLERFETWSRLAVSLLPAPP